MPLPEPADPSFKANAIATRSSPPTRFRSFVTGERRDPRATVQGHGQRHLCDPPTQGMDTSAVPLDPHSPIRPEGCVAIERVDTCHFLVTCALY